MPQGITFSTSSRMQSITQRHWVDATAISRRVGRVRKRRLKNETNFQ